MSKIPIGAAALVVCVNLWWNEVGCSFIGKEGSTDQVT